MTTAARKLAIYGFQMVEGSHNFYGLLEFDITNLLALFLFRRVLGNHPKVVELSGTVFVTSVSMFSTIPGYIIPYSGGPKAVSFAVGSSMKKPVVKGGSIVIRELLNITVSFNHDAVDGAPAARFLNQLRKCIEADYRSLL